MTGQNHGYVHGASDTPLIGDTIGVHLTAWRHCRRTGQPWSCVTRTFAGPTPSFGRKGGRPGSQLSWRSASGPAKPHRHLVADNAEWILTQFATAKAGLILVNINPAYRMHRAGVRPQQGRRQSSDPRARIQVE